MKTDTVVGARRDSNVYQDFSCWYGGVWSLDVVDGSVVGDSNLSQAGYPPIKSCFT